MRFSAILDFRLETTDMAVCELSRRRNSQLFARAAVRARMQPDVSVGFGTEVEESGRWFDYAPWVLAFVLVAVYIGLAAEAEGWEETLGGDDAQVG